MFNAKNHFLSKLPPAQKDEILDVTPNIWLGNTPYVPAVPKPEKKEHPLPYSKITASVASDLHRLFVEYVASVKKENPSISFVSALYRFELMGVHISPIHTKDVYTTTDTLRKGILINETKNTMVISFDGITKIFPKAMYNFFLHIDNAKYFVIGQALKSDRRYAK